jgi:hypothetical protein
MKRTKEAEEKDTNMKNSDSYTANPTNAKTDDPSGMSAIARKLNSLTKKRKY